MKKLLSIAAASALLLTSSLSFAELNSSNLGDIDNKACSSSAHGGFADFCTCFEADARSNCKKLGGGGICTKGSMPTIVSMTSGEVRTFGTLTKFCKSSIVKGLGISYDDCYADNGLVFNENGTVKQPYPCPWKGSKHFS